MPSTCVVRRSGRLPSEVACGVAAGSRDPRELPRTWESVSPARTRVSFHGHSRCASPPEPSRAPQTRPAAPRQLLGARLAPCGLDPALELQPAPAGTSLTGRSGAARAVHPRARGRHPAQAAGRGAAGTRRGLPGPRAHSGPLRPSSSSSSSSCAPGWGRGAGGRGAWPLPARVAAGTPAGAARPSRGQGRRAGAAGGTGSRRPGRAGRGRGRRRPFPYFPPPSRDARSGAGPGPPLAAGPSRARARGGGGGGRRGPARPGRLRASGAEGGRADCGVGRRRPAARWPPAGPRGSPQDAVPKMRGACGGRGVGSSSVGSLRGRRRR